jgi:hypothetical protein
MKYCTLFDDQPRLTDKYVHKITMKDETPFYLKSYPFPEAHQHAVNQKIHEMKEQGIIKAAKTPFVSPMLVVKKRIKVQDVVWISVD